jgi:hypothetical protein
MTLYREYQEIRNGLVVAQFELSKIKNEGNAQSYRQCGVFGESANLIFDSG